MVVWTTIYYVFFTTPVMLILAILVWQNPTWDQIGWLFFMGLVGTLGQRAMARGFAAADASIMLPMDFTRLLFGSTKNSCWAPGTGLVYATNDFYTLGCRSRTSLGIYRIWGDDIGTLNRCTSPIPIVLLYNKTMGPIHNPDTKPMDRGWAVA